MLAEYGWCVCLLFWPYCTFENSSHCEHKYRTSTCNWVYLLILLLKKYLSYFGTKFYRHRFPYSKCMGRSHTMRMRAIHRNSCPIEIGYPTRGGGGQIRQTPDQTLQRFAVESWTERWTRNKCQSELLYYSKGAEIVDKMLGLHDVHHHIEVVCLDISSSQLKSKVMRAAQTSCRQGNR